MVDIRLYSPDLWLSNGTAPVSITPPQRQLSDFPWKDSPTKSHQNVVKNLSGV